MSSPVTNYLNLGRVLKTLIHKMQKFSIDFLHNCGTLTREQDQIFHLLFSFQTTRASQPTQDDWRKLRNVIEYLRQTRSLSLILKVDNSNPYAWSTDAAYTVHGHYKSYNCGSYTMGKGFFFMTSCKYKTNTKLSCEATLIAVKTIRVSTFFWIEIVS